MSYTEVNIDEFNTIVDVNFNDDEINKIKKYYSNFRLYISSLWYIDITKGKPPHIIDIKVLIRKSIDDYYFVERYTSQNDNNHFYKCDQLSGLLKCLKQITK